MPSDLYGQGTRDRFKNLQILKRLSHPVSNFQLLDWRSLSTSTRSSDQKVLYRLHFNPLAAQCLHSPLCSLLIIVSSRCIFNLPGFPVSYIGFPHHVFYSGISCLCIPLSIATTCIFCHIKRTSHQTHISHHRMPILQYRTPRFLCYLEPYILHIHICITNAYAHHLLLLYTVTLSINRKFRHSHSEIEKNRTIPIFRHGCM